MKPLIKPAGGQSKPTSRQLKPAKRQRLQQLLAHPSIWQANHSQAGQGLLAGAVQTGFTQIDRSLQTGGWPTGGLIECLHEQAAQGELYPFMPALKQLAQADGRPPVLLIAPPCLPFSTAWQQYGIDCKQLWVLSPASASDLLWAAEQVLGSNCCAAVFIWLQQNSSKNWQLDWKQLRKLQLAAQQSNGLAILFRHSRFRQHSSPASLRLSLSTSTSSADPTTTSPTTIKSRYKSHIRLDIIKQPGSWGGQQVSIPWHRALQQAAIPASEWPVHIPAPQNRPAADRFGPEWINPQTASRHYS